MLRNSAHVGTLLGILDTACTATPASRSCVLRYVHEPGHPAPMNFVTGSKLPRRPAAQLAAKPRTFRDPQRSLDDQGLAEIECLSYDLLVVQK